MIERDPRYSLRMRPRVLLVPLLAAACVLVPPPNDGSPDAGTSNGVPVIDATTPLHDGADYTSVRIKYRSDGYQVFAVVCAPKTAGKHGLVLFSHGGFDGLADEKDGTGSKCAAWTKKGFVFAASSYRGEDGSDGHVEFCGGEVDDVRNLLKLMQVRDDVDVTKIVAIGESHGACITAELAATEKAVKAAAAVNGIYDMGAWNTWLGQQAQTGDEMLRTSYARLHTQLDAVAQADPAALEARSPARHLGAWLAPLALFHGQDDIIVPPDQGCLMRAAVAAKGLAIDGYYLDEQAHPLAQPPMSCGGAFQAALPGAPASRSLRLYRGEGHEFSGAGHLDADAAIDAFIAAQLGT